jgi:hypothetical protein
MNGGLFMKKILLIGDSIRLGYDQYVKESMTNLADVYYPAENCRFALYVLKYLHTWKEELKIDNVDAIHWNAGLWDTLKIYGDDCLTKLDHYLDCVERITDRIKFLFPNAKIIFAMSTPVIESGFIEEFEMRYNADVERYNEAACEVLKKKGVIINDLYGLLKDVPDSYHSDQTHFYTADATELIGGKVNEVLCDALGMDKSLLITPDKMKFEAQKGKNDTELFVKRGKYYEKVLGI